MPIRKGEPHRSGPFAGPGCTWHRLCTRVLMQSADCSPFLIWNKTSDALVYYRSSGREQSSASVLARLAGQTPRREGLSSSEGRQVPSKAFHAGPHNQPVIPVHARPGNSADPAVGRAASPASAWPRADLPVYKKHNDGGNLTASSRADETVASPSLMRTTAITRFVQPVASITAGYCPTVRTCCREPAPSSLRRY